MAKTISTTTKTVIKRPAPRAAGHRADLYLRTTSPFVSTLKKVDKLHLLLAREKRKHVAVFAQGKAIAKALSVGVKYQSNGYKVDIITGSVDVLDEIDDGDENKMTELKSRPVATVEVRIFTKDG